MLRQPGIPSKARLRTTIAVIVLDCLSDCLCQFVCVFGPRRRRRSSSSIYFCIHLFDLFCIRLCFSLSVCCLVGWLVTVNKMVCFACVHICYKALVCSGYNIFWSLLSFFMRLTLEFCHESICLGREWGGVGNWETIRFTTILCLAMFLLSWAQNWSEWMNEWVTVLNDLFSF